jgi:hypothetical protein
MWFIGMAAAALCVVGLVSDPAEARGRGRSIGAPGQATRVVVVPISTSPRETQDAAAPSTRNTRERSAAGDINGAYSNRRGAGVPVNSVSAPLVSAVPGRRPMPNVPPLAPAFKQEPPSNAKTAETAPASASDEHAPHRSRPVAAVFRVHAAAERASYRVKPCNSRRPGDLFCSLN